MDIFSLEKMSEDIHYGKTKEYFLEVLSSYQNRNFRSAVVMLWSVAVCDIIYKLQHLIDLYDDASAKKILRELTAMQELDEKSPAWEIKLVMDVHSNTHLLDSSEFENLKFLQKQRHLSAHPVLNSERELHAPNKETVRSLLRNTLEGVLIKPPFYSQRITDELLEDIAESQAVLNNAAKVKRYIESRYLGRTTPEVELSIFRSLWKLVFILDNNDCEKNRIVNLHVLEVLASRNSTVLSDYIDGDKDYFSNIASSGQPLEFIVYFLAKNSHLFSHLTDDAKLKVEHSIQTNDVGKTMGWFVKDHLAEHASDIVAWIESDDQPSFTPTLLDALLEISDTDEWQELFFGILTSYYTGSGSFDLADTRYQVAIPKYIGMFSKSALITLADKIESNNQCWGRGSARQDYEVIKRRIDDLFEEDFDYETCPYFRRKVVVA